MILLKKKYYNSIRKWALIVIILNVFIILASFRYYEIRKKTIIDGTFDRLESVTHSKIEQINDWKNERLSDARYLSLNPLVQDYFHELDKNRENSGYRKRLYNILYSMFLNGKYERMIAIDSEGYPLFSIPAIKDKLSSFLSQDLNLIRNSGRIQQSGPYIYNDSIAEMQILVPCYDLTTTDTLVTGWLLLNTNLTSSLFPLLESFPFSSTSMEILMMSRRDNQLICLNKSKIPPITFDSIRKGSLLPINKAIRGSYGSEEGVDYQGVKVFAHSAPVACNNSFIVVKINKSEIFSQITSLKVKIIGMTLLVLFVITLTGWLHWRGQRNEIALLLAEKRFISERFNLLSQFANDAILLYTDDFTIIQVNDKALELYKYSREEFLGMHAEMLIRPEDIEDYHNKIEITRREGGLRFECEHVKKDKTRFHIEVSLRYMQMFGSHCFQCIVRDITQRKQFEKALIESEERLRLITNTMPQIVWTAGPDGRMDFVNSRFETLTRLNPLKETSITGFIHPEDQDRVVAYWKDAVNVPREHRIRFRILMNDNTYRWFLCIAIPLCSAGGRIIRWYGSATDIDELENRVTQRTAELTDLYNNAPCGYYSLDISGTFIKINDTALQWLGYSGDEIIGKLTLMDVITSESKLNFKHDFKELMLKGFLNNVEYEMVRKNGSLLNVLLSATAVKDPNDNIIMIRSTIIDHTERKQHENEIIKLNTILQEHSYNLENSNKELEAFIYSVSHDLRAPLRAINGFSRILLDEYNDTLDNEGKRLLSTVCNNADKMRDLIEDLLRLSRASRQELSYTQIDMNALFSSMVEEAKQLFPDRKIQARINIMPSGYGDLALLKQVISNLLSNAVKFSCKREISEITIGSIDGYNESTYYVKDNGTGFDMKYVGELFGVFRRLNNADAYEGTGVGLALVKRIIDKHGGKVWAESKPDEGATFYFSIPDNQTT